MQTSTWKALEVFASQISSDRITFKEEPLELPKGLVKAVHLNWEQQLDEKREKLQREGILTTKVRDTDASGIPFSALYQGETPMMQPVSSISLKGWKQGVHSVELCVRQTSYPFIEGLKNPEIRKLYDEQGIEIPKPPLAICTFTKTIDGYLVSSVRGKTIRYDGRFDGQGGNPPHVAFDLGRYQEDAIARDILVNSMEKGSFQYGGIVVDTEQLEGKPALVGWNKVGLKADEIRERVYARPMDQRPKDAVGVMFLPENNGRMLDFLVNMTPIQQVCPVAHGGLTLYGHHNFGEAWSTHVLADLDKKANP